MPDRLPEGIPAKGEIIAGKYRVERVLGQGGMGVVVAAYHEALRLRVAVKFLLPSARRHPEATARFQREARAVAAITSEHVPRVLDVGVLDSGAPYLVMEYLTGTDLRAVLKARGRLPVAEAVDYLLQACEALAEAHAAGIIHRDLKPSNLFLAERPTGGPPVVKVLDFGLSKATGAAEHDKSLTEPEVVMGSYLYMSPEQGRGMKNADARADIWSLGVILYQLLAGQRPFDAGSLTESLLMIANDPPPPLASFGVTVPKELGAVLSACLEKDRARRPQTVAALAVALEPFGTRAARASVERIVRAQGGAAPASAPSSREDASVTAAIKSAPRTPAPWRRSRVAAWSTVALITSAVSAWAIARGPSLFSRASSEIDGERLASFAPLPKAPPAPEDQARAMRIKLGGALFQDPRLSKNGDISCASCHPLDRYGVDGKKVSIGSDGKTTPRNALSIYNTAGLFAYLWDGRKENLADQAEEVLLSPRGMATSKERLEAVLTADTAASRAFREAFPGEPEPVTLWNAAMAIAAYEGTLLTRGRWDRFLEGEKGALSDDEKAGFNTFVEVGCISCHIGPGVGATMYQKVGLVKAWPEAQDQGRYAVTKREVDRMVFRVPSLRNVAMTGPYFHDGAVASLEEAVRRMARHQIGRELGAEDVRLIVAWLGSLTGEISGSGPSGSR